MMRCQSSNGSSWEWANRPMPAPVDDDPRVAEIAPRTPDRVVTEADPNVDPVRPRKAHRARRSRPRSSRLPRRRCRSTATGAPSSEQLGGGPAPTRPQRPSRAQPDPRTVSSISLLAAPPGSATSARLLWLPRCASLAPYVRTASMAPSLGHPWLRYVRTASMAPRLRHPGFRYVRTLLWVLAWAIPGSLRPPMIASSPIGRLEANAFERKTARRATHRPVVELAAPGGGGWKRFSRCHRQRTGRSKGNPRNQTMTVNATRSTSLVVDRDLPLVRPVARAARRCHGERASSSLARGQTGRPVLLRPPPGTFDGGRRGRLAVATTDRRPSSVRSRAEKSWGTFAASHGTRTSPRGPWSPRAAVDAATRRRVRTACGHSLGRRSHNNTVVFQRTMLRLAALARYRSRCRHPVSGCREEWAREADGGGHGDPVEGRERIVCAVRKHELVRRRIGERRWCGRLRA